MQDRRLGPRFHPDLVLESDPKDGWRVAWTLAVVLGFRDGERTEAQSNGNRGTTRAIQVESGRVPSLRSTGTRTTRLGGWRIPNPSLSTQTQRENDPHDTTSLRPPHERSGEAT